MGYNEKGTFASLDFHGVRGGEPLGLTVEEVRRQAEEAQVNIPQKPEPFKYREGEILDELRVYLASTYGQHYVGKNSIQANDLVLAGDQTEARGFWKWNAIKYLLRYGKKKGTNKQDLLKALHYTILLMYLDHDQHNGEGE